MHASLSACCLCADPLRGYREAPSKFNPLAIAAFNGRHEVIEVLLNRNANVNYQ